MIPVFGTADRSGRHLSDADLFRHLDGEALPEADVGHLRACDRCSDRLCTLSTRSARFSDLLGVADEYGREAPSDARVPLPLPRRRRSARRAAIVVGLLAAASLASPRTRGAIARIGELVWVAADERAVDPTLDARVVFDPAGTVLQVVFSSPQPEGRLTLIREDDDQATLRAVPPLQPVEFVVQDGWLLVINPVEDAVDYELGVPRGVETLRVRVGDRLVADLVVRDLQIAERPHITLNGETQTPRR